MKALRLPACASTVAYFVRFHRPRDPPAFVFAVALLKGWRPPPGLGTWVPAARSSGYFTWTQAGPLRSPGDPSCTFAPLLDPGRTDVPLPWRSHRCCPRVEHNEGFGRCKFRGSLTQLRYLLSYASRFALPLTRKAGFRLAGWPLPGGRRTLWIATKGFSSHEHSPFLSS
jgi:hypothetical protein